MQLRALAKEQKPNRFQLLFTVGVLILAFGTAFGANRIRRDVLIDSGWRTVESADGTRYAGFEQPGFDDGAWTVVEVPHNWDDYYGFHQVKHGNLHGSAWYRRPFALDPADRGKRIFLEFEGVGSYAAVWVNGRPVGRHAGGRTSFTLDITSAVDFDGTNVVAVRADHPAGIRDLPWVCGGCNYRTGFSEGSQPMGIFRPVHLIVTSPVRVEPFGVHIWNGNDISAQSAIVHVNTEVRNYDSVAHQITIVSGLRDEQGTAVWESRTECVLPPGKSAAVKQVTPALSKPHLWSLADPYLYRLLTQLVEGGKAVDEVETPFGIRWIEWPAEGSTNRQFLLNGKPVFINGTCEYEHMLGDSHAFTAEQIRTRAMQVLAAGFNAFRDAHQPHNLRYQNYWERLGVLWWPQFSAQIWFDTPAFRTNFLSLLRDWVKERRNNPAVILWGLQNESKLPVDFAKQCVQVIRELDPTASSQRKVTTCNGGTGADWNVPQDWSGTYGGDPATYARDAIKDRLVGEYGGYRSIGFHREGPFDLKKDQPHIASEDRLADLLETKVRLAESVRDQFCGQFQWLLATHDNPGRSVEYCNDGIRELDRIGVVNNKGLLTSWGEPVDAFYMYRANYVPAATQPMVYIVSHTWPDRWPTPGRKRRIIVYSNCQQVELFNDFKHHSLGRRTRGTKGTHFQWDDADIEYNLLYAEGLMNGKVVATDVVLLHDLPKAPHFDALDPNPADLTAPDPGQHYLYRVNCGGPDYTDVNGNTWSADRHWERGDSWGSISWAEDFPDVPPDFASKRKISGPIAGTADDVLFQTFRYGRNKLKYRFAVPDGDYRVELYFIEPWYGTGGGMDCTGWRLFDVAVNGSVVLTNLDIWKEAGRARALKKVVAARARHGELVIGFPRVASYQAVISAIAISTADSGVKAPRMPEPLIDELRVNDQANASAFSARECLDAGDQQYGDVAGEFTVVPPKLVEANWIRTANASRYFQGAELMRFKVTRDAEVYVALDQRIQTPPSWLAGWLDLDETMENNRAGGVSYELYRKRFPAGSSVVLGENGRGESADADMYSVIVKRAWPPPPPRLIRDFAVTGATDPRQWRALGKLRTEDLQYSDANPVVTALSSSLYGSDWIRAPRRANSSETMRFTVDQDVEVHVALDPRTTPVPGWLAGWIKTRRTFVNSDPDSGRFQLYRRRFASNAVVELGGLGREAAAAGAPMYTVLVNEARPSVSYPADAARLSGAVLARETPGDSTSGYIRFEHATGDAVEWKVVAGVGDIYGLRFHYAYGGATPVPLELEIVNSGGRIISSERLEFPPVSAQDRWGDVEASTGVSINAGTYTIRLTTVGAGGPDLRSLELE